LRQQPIEIDGESDAHAWTTTVALADRFGLSVCDPSYLELGEHRNLPVVSRDKRLRSASATLGPGAAQLYPETLVRTRSPRPAVAAIRMAPVIVARYAHGSPTRLFVATVN
jgi:hypothetical protein